MCVCYVSNVYQCIYIYIYIYKDNRMYCMYEMLVNKRIIHNKWFNKLVIIIVDIYIYYFFGGIIILLYKSARVQEA